ncbi:ATP-binding protein [Amycolatopsis minnesotensis]|uniref:BTAD domain-containing putative transcriptional regulator n=1 Tax=Amycolatopsis minnesotensis TaxID=337894 RepID=A0ABP5CYN0_9PSEU
MRFGILGPTEIRSTTGEPVPPGGPGLRALLALLLLDAGRVVGHERILDGLYREPGQANALQSQVSRLRRIVPGLVEYHPAGYRIAADPDDVDAHRFTRLANDGNRALASDPALAARLLAEALGLWRGDALSDVLDAPFAADAAARFADLRLGAMEDLAEARLMAGETRGVVDALDPLVEGHPLRERSHALLMRALHGSGRQADALAVFDRIRRRLAVELGTDPSPELTDVHLAILRAAPSATAPPAPFTSFVGRDDDVQRVGKLLGESRLVTVTGPGGSGKTRLAVEVARQRDSCFADLSTVDESGVVHAVLAAVGARDSGLLPGRGAPEAETALVSALADGGPLLVLDNCEHVVDATARLAKLILTRCPRARLLTTSREALGITGESLHVLPPLPVPSPGAERAEALASPAVRLFVDRAAAVRPGFDPGERAIELVARICLLLDGLPLAIELAAARLRALPLDEVADRIGDRFRLLSQGDRTATPRHRTLHAVVEWSWRLLTDEERSLARRLTVFTDGATLGAAAAVCGTADVLPSLVMKSFVELRDGRYRMLETIRAFAAERLVEAGERDRLREAHARYFLELAETADPRLRASDQLIWLARLKAEHGNLHAAFRHAVTGADIATGFRFAGALSWYWWLSGRRDEGRHLTARLLGEGPLPGLAEEYLLCVVNADSDDPAAFRLAESILTEPGLRLRRPQALFLFRMAGNPGDEVPSGLLGDDAWPSALRELGTGHRALFRGRARAAETAFRRALDGFRSIGDRWGAANALDRLAELARWWGAHEEAAELTGEALAVLAELGAVRDTADLLCRRAYGVICAGGDLAAAHADYERAVELARTSGGSDTVARAQCGLGEIARLRGDVLAARHLFELALGGSDDTRARAKAGLSLLTEANPAG